MAHSPISATGYGGPLRLSKQLQGGVVHPLSGVPIEVAGQMRGSGLDDQLIHVFDHFAAGVYPLVEGVGGAYTLVGTTGVALGVIEAEDYGVYRLESGVVEDDNAVLRHENLIVNYSTTQDVVFATRLSVSDADDMEVFVGLTVSNSDFVAGLPASGIFFSKAETATQLTLQVRESGTSTSEAFGPVLTDGGDVILVIRVVDGNVHAHIKDVAAAAWYDATPVLSTDANMPLVTDDLLVHYAIETGASLAKNLQIDWLYVGKESA